jgi:oligopeptide transport system permease protein
MSDTIAASVQPEAGEEVGEARSLGQDAWRSLRSNKMFWASVILIGLFVLMSIWPSLFTKTDPSFGDISNVRDTPSADHWFGTDTQGYDIYARTIYGARASILVGTLASLTTLLLGGLVGVLSGFYGRWLDALLSRITDIFYAIPLILGGILFMASFPNGPNSNYFIVVGKVVLVLTVFGWPTIARLMRSSVLQVKPNEYVLAARALGASPWRIIRSHILPNALAPAIVVATINLGVFIVVEATLSFLGIGLTPPAISWGVAISDALSSIRTYPHVLFFPSLFLSLAVLAFILLGDAVRDAFDPKSR